ncbi:HTH-type sugar sensing transcriptional regulator TrmBL1 [uncultured archaeon]|nr:HTH-type sugar sensing transcriptional regulator TrmBL1 [uncultured archaeon]
MIEKLKKLGLTGYESQAYLALLELGDGGADEIALNAKIPMGRIYNVLSNLEEAHLVRAQDTRPRRYTCVNPAAAMEWLSKNKLEELRRTGEEIETLANALATELSGVSGKKTDKTFWTVAIGEESHELVRESIMGSQRELLVFMPSKITSERLRKDLMKEDRLKILNALYETTKKGVEIKVVLNKEVDFSLFEEFPVVKQLLKYQGNGFNCRFAAIPATPFDIIDGESVLLQMLNPINPEELFAVVNIKDAKLAEELRKKFYTIWDKAPEYFGKNTGIIS